MPPEAATYSHGHHPSVISTHARRTALNSASFLLPHLTSTFHILDLGCGPGTITCDLATYVPSGSIIGIDAVDSILSQARSLASSRSLTNITFETGDANALWFEDGTFDVVFCHQLLQHVKDPIGVLREMKRVCKKGGVVAAREADYSSFLWEPQIKELEEWGVLYQSVARGNGGEPDAGRYLGGWFRGAGWPAGYIGGHRTQTLSGKGEGVDADTSSGNGSGKSGKIEVTWGSWCFTGTDAKEWAESWVGRAIHSDFAKGAVARGFATEEDLKRISEGWKRWAEDGAVEGWEDRIFVVGNAEVLGWC